MNTHDPEGQHADEIQDRPGWTYSRQGVNTYAVAMLGSRAVLVLRDEQIATGGDRWDTTYTPGKCLVEIELRSVPSNHPSGGQTIVLYGRELHLSDDAIEREGWSVIDTLTLSPQLSERKLEELSARVEQLKGERRREKVSGLLRRLSREDLELLREMGLKDGATP